MAHGMVVFEKGTWNEVAPELAGILEHDFTVGHKKLVWSSF